MKHLQTDINLWKVRQGCGGYWSITATSPGFYLGRFTTTRPCNPAFIVRERSGDSFRDSDRTVPINYGQFRTRADKGSRERGKSIRCRPTSAQ